MDCLDVVDLLGESLQLVAPQAQCDRPGGPEPADSLLGSSAPRWWLSHSLRGGTHNSALQERVKCREANLLDPRQSNSLGGGLAQERPRAGRFLLLLAGNALLKRRREEIARAQREAPLFQSRTGDALEAAKRTLPRLHLNNDLEFGVAWLRIQDALDLPCDWFPNHCAVAPSLKVIKPSLSGQSRHPAATKRSW